MPGHVKKSEGPDPDPDPWLMVLPELKIKLKAKPYDPKKSCWVPDKASGGYDEGVIDSTDGEKVTVTIIETKIVSIHNRVKILVVLMLFLRYNNQLNCTHYICIKTYALYEFSFI